MTIKETLEQCTKRVEALACLMAVVNGSMPTREELGLGWREADALSSRMRELVEEVALANEALGVWHARAAEAEAKLARVQELLAANGCECEVHRAPPCLICRIEEALKC